jgi:hypothetical protein
MRRMRGVRPVLGVTVLLMLAAGGLSAGAAPALPVLTLDIPAAGTPNVESTAPSCVDTGSACRRVRALARIGNTIYAGGVIDQVTQSGTTSTFTNLFAFDAVTSALRSGFQPQISGASGIVGADVRAIAPSTDGTALYIGGTFTTIGGQVRRGVAKISATTGALVTAFDARLGTAGGGYQVNDLAIVKGQLWIGGRFTNVGGASRTALASVDLTTGAVTGAVNVAVSGTTWGPEPTAVTAFAANPAQTSVVIVGRFTKVKGVERLQVAKLNVGSTGIATLSTWYSPYHFRASLLVVRNGARVSGCGGPNTGSHHTWPMSVDWIPDGTSFVITGTAAGHPYPALCDMASRWWNNESANAYAMWINYSYSDSFWVGATTGTYTYVGGHIKTLNWRIYRGSSAAAPALIYQDNTRHTASDGSTFYGELHFGVGVISTYSGYAVRAWNDTTKTTRGWGWEAMLSTPTGPGGKAGLWIGGDAEQVGGLARKRLAFFPVP